MGEVQLKRILFLCATNDSLSLMAEALLRHIDSRNFVACSASIGGQHAHPLSVEVMKEIGIDLGPRRSLDELRGQSFDLVITLDGTGARQNYSTLATETVYWKFENPLTVSENQQAQLRAFYSVRDQIAQRIRLLAIVHARTEHVAVASASSHAATPVI